MLETLLIFTSISLGAAAGSFINALSFRFHSGYSMLGRSQCFSCGKKLQWYELIPIVSFLMLGGRCERCKSSISFQYVGVEAVTALLFLFSYLEFGLSFYTLLAALISAVLVLILVYDMRHTIIPNAFVYTFIGLALLAAFVESGWGAQPDLLIDNVLAGVVYSAIFYLLWHASGGRWMGLGDAKLVAGIGILFGLVDGITAITLAFWIGAAVALSHMGIQRWWGQGRLNEGGDQLTMESEIPFAPYLVVGTFLVLFFDITIFFI